MNGHALRLLGLPAALLLLAVGCNPKQARAEKAVTTYRILLEEVIKFDEAFKGRPEVVEMPGFVNVLNQNIAQIKSEQGAVDQFVKNLKEDQLFQKVSTQAFNMRELPTYLRYANGVNGIPTTRYSKGEKLVILWTDEMGAVVQPRVNEINKLASTN